jgi:hypothetical protein
MLVSPEAASRLHPVFIDDAKRAETHVRLVVVVSE